MIQAPYTAGPLDAKVCIIGQAPGAEEHASGGAFVGPAGRQLTRFCAAAGLNRQTCRLENLFQFFPKNDDLDPYIRLGMKNVKTTPTYDEHVAALRERLEKCDANVFVPLGAISTYALTGIVGNITKWRGSLLSSTLLPGRKCLPSIHPSATLKGDPLFGYYITRDLIRAKGQGDFPEIRLRHRNMILAPTLEDIRSFLSRCLHQHLISYDIETRGLHLSHISFAVSPDDVLCIPLISGGQDVWSPDDETEIMLLVAKVLECDSVTKLGQNISFDCTFMLRRYGIYVCPVHDTMIAAAILFPDFPKGLDFLTSIYCDGEPYYKAEGKEWRKNPFASEELFRRYNAMDSAVLLEIFPQQKAELIKAGNWDTYLKQSALIHPLVYASNRGILMDREYLQAAAASCRERIAQMEVDLRSLVGPELNFNSNKQLVAYFYTEKGIKPYTRWRKGGYSSPSVDDKALERMAAHGVQEAQILTKIRKEQKMLSTYYEMKVDEDGRLRCSYNPVGTVQARISSSKTIWGTGANLQNQPSDTLRAMLADPGGIYISQDLAQAENRIVAYEACDPRMMEALEAGVDIHSLTGCLIHNVALDKCTEEIRQDGKVANHGLNFGLGVQNFILHYSLEWQHGTYVYERYHQVYPGVREWHASIREELARNNRVLTNCYGRARRFLDPDGPQLYQKAYDYKPQSTVATKMNEDGVKYLYYRQDLFPEARFSNTVHDSLWYWMPLSAGYDRIVRIIILVKTRLETPLTIKGRRFSIPVDTKIGFTLYDRTMLKWNWNKADFANPDHLSEELRRYVETHGR